MPDENIERESTLQIHYTDLQDSIIDPFDAQTDERSGLAVEQTATFKGESFLLTHRIYPDVNKQVNIRVRYSFWDALSDVGGFHDGLCLLVRLFMGPLAANFF